MVEVVVAVASSVDGAVELAVLLVITAFSLVKSAELQVHVEAEWPLLQGKAGEGGGLCCEGQQQSAL